MSPRRAGCWAPEPAGHRDAGGNQQAAARCARAVSRRLHAALGRAAGQYRHQAVQHLQQGPDELIVLSAPASPLRDLLTASTQQTQLSTAGRDRTGGRRGREARPARSARRPAVRRHLATPGPSLEQNEAVNILGELFGNDGSGKPIDPAKRVDDHFKPLHDFVTGTQGPAGADGGNDRSSCRSTRISTRPPTRRTRARRC